MGNRRGFSTIVLRLTLGLATLFVGFSSCSEQKWELISEREVRRLLPLHAQLSAKMQNQGWADSTKASVYRKFFLEQGYSLRDWDSTMAWYAKNEVLLYHDFYRQATDTINRLLTDLQAVQDSVNRIEEIRSRRTSYILDSVNLLSIGLETYHSGEYINRAFSIAPASAYEGVEVHLSTGVYGLSKEALSKQLELELKFHHIDTTITSRSIQIFKSGTYDVSMVVPPGKSVTRVSGRLVGLLPQAHPRKRVWCDSLRLIRFPYKEQAEVPPLVPQEEQVQPSDPEIIEEL